MKTTRFLALPAIAAASMLALAGCVQLPPVAGPSTETQAPAGGDTGTGSEELAGSSWSGNIAGLVEPISFTLADDGTVDITTWGTSSETYDSPSDVWSGDSGSLELTITGFEEGAFDVTFSGTAADGAMELAGEGTDGSSHTLSATQD